MAGPTRASLAPLFKTDRLGLEQGNEMVFLKRKKPNQNPNDLSHEFPLSSCCCQEPGCHRGTESTDKMPRKSYAQCPPQLFPLPGGDKAFLRKCFPDSSHFKCKISFGTLLHGEILSADKSPFEKLFASPRRSQACHQPQIYTLAHLPSMVLGRCQTSTEQLGSVPWAQGAHL